ncbi:hypothetical protein [Acidovorax sp. sic0104]|nr:hypothetical protein [Acidovorax sp. sic0104]
MKKTRNFKHFCALALDGKALVAIEIVAVALAQATCQGGAA